jgi:urease accessory protein
MTENNHLSLVRLMQLSSNALPIGSFTYSQGLEWAVECGWITTEHALQTWLTDLVKTNVQHLEIPVLVRMVDACSNSDLGALQYWSDHLTAHRETSELRLEEHNRGRAMARLLIDLDLNLTEEWSAVVAKTQTAGYAFAVDQWHIPLEQAAYGFAWSWLENLVLSGIKLIPLGQVSGQRILMEMADILATSVEHALTVEDEQIGSSAPALAYVSAKHETQYTRLFRS